MSNDSKKICIAYKKGDKIILYHDETRDIITAKVDICVNDKSDVDLFVNSVSCLKNIDVFSINILFKHNYYDNEPKKWLVECYQHILKLLENLLSSPKSNIRLKDVTIILHGSLSEYHDPDDRKSLFVDIIRCVSKLHTKPILTVDSMLALDYKNANLGIEPINDLGYISEVYIYAGYSSKARSNSFDFHFPQKFMENSFIKKIGIISKMYLNHGFIDRHTHSSSLTEPKDQVMIAKEILSTNSQELVTNTDKFGNGFNCVPIAPNHGFYLRKNHNLLSNYNQICNMLFMNYKFGNKNPYVYVENDPYYKIMYEKSSSFT